MEKYVSSKTRLIRSWYYVGFDFDDKHYSRKVLKVYLTVKKINTILSNHEYNSTNCVSWYHNRPIGLVMASWLNASGIHWNIRHQ